MLEKTPHISDDLSARDRLLEVGARLFAEHGLEGTSVRDIAKEAGLNLSLVSYYFGGKEGLYKELISTFAFKITIEIQKIIAISEAEETSKENIEKVFMMLVSSFTAIRANQPHLAVIMQRERIAGLPFARAIYENNMTPVCESLVRVITRGQDQGFVRKDLNPLLVFIFLKEAIIGFHNNMDCQVAMTESTMAHKQNFKDYQKQLVTIFVQGILA